MLNVSILTNLDITLDNVEVMLKRRLILLMISMIDNKEPILFLTLNSDEKDDKFLWFLENKASNHICGYKEKFVKLGVKCEKKCFFWRHFQCVNPKERYHFNFFEG